MQPVGEACVPTEVAIIELPHDSKIMLKSCDLDHNFFFL